MTRAAMMSGLIATAGAVSALHAGVTEDAVDRYNLTFAEGGFDVDGPNSTNGPASGAWLDDNFSSAVMSGNGSSSNGYQDSYVNNGAYGGYVDARADAFGDGSDFASAYGESNLTVDFTLGAGGGDWTLEGYVNAFGEINGEVSEAYIELIDLSDNSVIWGAFVSDDFVTFDEGGSLAAGSYRIEANALTIVNRTFEDSFGDSTATVDFDFTVTPAPGSVALLAFGGLGCAARRRRS